MKDVKDEGKCGLSGAFWSHRSKLVGGFFLIVATILTLLTLNGFGILGMFLVGTVLCRRHMMCGCCSCHSSCSEKCSPCDTGTCEPELTPIKTAVKKPAVKKQG